MSDNAIRNEKAPASQNVRSVKFISKFNSLVDALKASEIDISYNPDSAMRKAIYFDINFKPIASFIAEDGEIYSHYRTRDGLCILGKFSPFSSCLDDNNFKLAELLDDDAGFVVFSAEIPKSRRNVLTRLQATYSKIVVLSE